MTTNVGIVGFRGYSGMELERILSAHAGVTPWLLEHRADSVPEPQPLGHIGPERIPCTAEAAQDAGISLVFLATPPEVSMELSAAFLAANIRVVDLSGAFRLGTPENYKHWYKHEHTQPALLASAVYGLPEFYRADVPQARLLSNPGCYPTAANLAIRPLIQAGVIDPACGVICDAKSGVSGAGRKASLKTAFSEVTENFSAYSILDHRHVPEVLMTSNLREEDFSFTAQLIPIHRGILETVYFRAHGVGDSADLLQIYVNAYRNEPFVRLYPVGAIPDLRAVNGTNFCDIGVKMDPKTGRAVVVSCIDNLGKGAAGQAVQNMNLMLGFDETEGLL
ncbi:N-acetyl-gamma-glutamyl-phosphate reductase [uncultured Paludibaculum sp.]|uniref:N-acetyl-gamma-glutamyl-phosphate reductase n=1 Tax=uncultured Paludibaculum sp. TaxID=1765020 RepID=UPI002AAADF1C|nr:N-acetyl-gamma-glutamyl-phosphate reductase [uncultured Paludibaculum sp.]